MDGPFGASFRQLFHDPLSLTVDSHGIGTIRPRQPRQAYRFKKVVFPVFLGGESRHEKDWLSQDLLHCSSGQGVLHRGGVTHDSQSLLDGKKGICNATSALYDAARSLLGSHLSHQLLKFVVVVRHSRKKVWPRRGIIGATRRGPWQVRPEINTPT